LESGRGYERFVEAVDESEKLVWWDRVGCKGGRVGTGEGGEECAPEGFIYFCFGVKGKIEGL
jgi:hypothetical protein